MVNLQPSEPLSDNTESLFSEIRKTNNLRALTAKESGSGVDNLPSGVYGFTYSPATDNFPLFSVRNLRSYEGHKRVDGSVTILGFLTKEEKQEFDTISKEATIHLFAEPKGSADQLVSIPISRVLNYEEHSQRTGSGLALIVS